MATPQDRRDHLRQVRQDTADGIEAAVEAFEQGEIDSEAAQQVQAEIIIGFLWELINLLTEEQDTEPANIDVYLRAAYGACCAYMDYRFNK